MQVKDINVSGTKHIYLLDGSRNVGVLNGTVKAKYYLRKVKQIEVTSSGVFVEMEKDY